MKFKGTPNQLCRITKISKSMIRKVPKSIRFNDEGEFETENPYLIKRLKTKFEVVVDGFDKETVEKIKEVIENRDIDALVSETIAKTIENFEQKKEIIIEEVKLKDIPYPELQVMYAKKTGESAVGKRKIDILKELED